MSPARREGSFTLAGTEAIASVDARLCALLGRPLAELLGRPFSELIDVADRLAWSDWLAGPGEEPIDVRLTRPGGQGWWASLARVPSGGVLPEGHRLLLVSDASERRMAELALHDSEDRFDAFMNASEVAAWMKDEAGRFVYVNRGWESAHGRGRAEALGATAFDLFPRAYAEQLARYDEEVLKSGRHLATSEGDPGGERVWQTVRFLFWDHDGRRYLGGLSLDRTARRRAEDELRALREQYLHAQKMEAVGRLAGGAAHDFNNLLTVVVNYADLLLQRAGPSDPSREPLEQIAGAAQRAGALARQLLNFSRLRATERRPLELEAELEAMVPMLRRLIGPLVELRTELASGPARARADAGELGQVVMNLVINALDAMPHGGRITLSTRLVSGAGGARLHLGVADTGCGMEEEVRAHIFEPYFTTKELGRGTGLGLSTVFDIVKQWGGDIEVTSKVGQGSRFVIQLPLGDEPQEAAAAPSHPPSPRGHEVLLLVDDEAHVRRVTRMLLEEEGYQVLEAPGPFEALALLESGEPISLLLTDLLMPGMRGEELARRARALRSGLKVLTTSGHGSVDGVAGLPFLHKPYTADALTQMVRRVLDA